MTDLFGAITLFVRVARTGSFSLVARERGISQPTVSRAIGALEKEIGVTLFVRTSRAVKLTEAGVDYFGRVECILTDLEDATHSVRGTGEIRGSLRVGLSSTFGLRELIPRLPRFLEQHPELNLSMLFDDKLQDLVGMGIDVAFRYGSLADSTAVARRICSCTRVAVAAPSYLAHAGTPETPAELSKHSLVSGPATVAPTLSFIRDKQTVSIKMKTKVVASLNEALIAAASMGFGVAVTSLGSCMKEVAAGVLVQLLPEWRLSDLELHAIYPAGRAASPAARALTEFIVREMGGQDPYPLPTQDGRRPTKKELEQALLRVRSTAVYGYLGEPN